MSDDPLIESLRAAVSRAPDDVALRTHLARLLLDAGRATESLAECAEALRRRPGDPGATALLAEVTADLTGRRNDPTGPQPGAPNRPADPPAPAGNTDPPAPNPRPLPAGGPGGFDWDGAEAQMRDPDPPRTSPGDQPTGAPGSGTGGGGTGGPPGAPPGGWERDAVTLADVGGMDEVKAEIRSSFLVPMANPELRAAYGAAMGGGLLLYGPPGCGKTFLARAIAGELGAAFTAVSLADVLDMWLGQSERNIKSLFDGAREHRPAVIFLDEIDALGQRRSNLRSNPAMRGTVNQLLSEMDGAGGDNDGLFVLAATNQPWDVDPALRRPGRFDRMLFVAPPDHDARAAILELHLRGRPVGSVDLDRLARETSGYSGADLAHLCTVALRSALADSAASGTVRPVEMADLDSARRQVKPSTGEWLATARNAATFANQDGTYDDLDRYLKGRRR